MSSPKGGLAPISGPASMAKPSPNNNTGEGASSSTRPNANGAPRQDSNPPKKKKTHRGGKNRKRNNRRQSFVAPSEATEDTEVDMAERPSLLDVPHPRSSTQQASLYRLRQGNRSNTSLESEALLDHRGHDMPRPRRRSVQGFARPSVSYQRNQPRTTYGNTSNANAQRSFYSGRPQSSGMQEAIEDEDEDADDRTPLLSNSLNKNRPDMTRGPSHGGRRPRRASQQSKASSGFKFDMGSRSHEHHNPDDEDYDVNNPPSVPNSPKLASTADVMIGDMSKSLSDRGRDAIINIDGDDEEENEGGYSSSPDAMRRRATMAELAERDVCFPGDADLTEADVEEHPSRVDPTRRRRRRQRQWPDFDILEEWSREEKEERTQQEVLRAKKISEPVMVGGRLRPRKTVWHAEEDDEPFRFTYFNEFLDGTIHARTIADLCQDNTTFQDLFRPEPAELSDSSDDEDDQNDDRADQSSFQAQDGRVPSGQLAKQLAPHSEPGDKASDSNSKANTLLDTPSAGNSQAPTPQPQKAKRYGPKPTWWLDVLKPTEMEMKVLAKAFGIHQLTIEDILMEEPREKVELFQSYYFVNYRSFEQDKDSEDYMEPLNIYVVVFRDGVITFHQSMTPHPANVRRRIRQLNDYMSPSADWISYAIIDDVTDAYAPLVQQIEDEVDDIDEEILNTHSSDASLSQQNQKQSKSSKGEKAESQADMGASKSEGDKTAGEKGGDMLRRVGECRKKVMGLYRLLGNKADVIKGFAKRCNEHWEVAPRSEIGLYLGDIQDHIVTMTGNLSHYENLLSRAHGNYLAQINIRMNERAEQTADVLGKLTVLGTIVLPMNIVTGMWGMNVWVPGQGDEENLTWFWVITAGLLTFGLACYFIAKRVYGIV